jgi:hypothetical protein
VALVLRDHGHWFGHRLIEIQSDESNSLILLARTFQAIGGKPLLELGSTASPGIRAAVITLVSNG